MPKENNEFKVPDKINNTMLAGFYKEKKANKDKRIKEILKRLKLSDSLDNLVKADRVIERRVAMGLLSVDYELMDDEEKAYSGGVQAQTPTLTTNSNTNNNTNIPLNLISKLLGGIIGEPSTSETAEAQVIFRYNGKLVNMNTTFIKNVLADYMENHDVPNEIMTIAEREELTATDEQTLLHFFDEDKSFQRFCMDKKIQGK